MCGIFGFFHRGGRHIDEDRIARMGASIRHRGPDDHGTFQKPGLTIGNQRLSVIDIAEGHQPFVSDCGNIAVVQNGEIFNYRELAQELADRGNPCRTKSDTETLLRLYELDGIDFLDRLNGMFAIAIWDDRTQTLHLARDRIGKKPLYVHDDGAQLTFGSEVKAMLPALGNRPAPNPRAIHHFLTYNYVPAPLTMFEGITHIMPGHRMEITKAGQKISKWWDLSAQQPVEGRSEADWIEELNALMGDAVRLRMRCDVPFGAFLSG